AHTTRASSVPAPALEAVRAEGGFLGWVDRMLSN
ncbi:MAG: ferredoxin, partial [Mesorhizobium sp.]